MKAANDRFTIDFVDGTRPGRRPAAHPLSPAKRQQARRARLKEEGRTRITIEIDARVKEELANRAKSEDSDVNKIVEMILNAALFPPAQDTPPASASVE